MAPVLLAVLLSAPLQLWRAEIEKTGLLSVQLIALQPGASVPAETPHKAVLEQFTDNPNFQEQLRNAQALSITYQGAEGRLSFVVLNPDQTGPADEPYVIAHELGHLWLKALRYPAPAYFGGPSSCLSILTGDAVQHVLIRQEMDRRKIAWRESWQHNLKAALAALDAQRDPPPPARCQALSQTVLWIDVELGLTDDEWPERNRFLATLSRQFPMIQPIARDIASRLRRQNLAEKSEHQKALQDVFNKLKALALTVPNG